MLPVQLGCVRARQGRGVDGAYQRLAVVFVQAGQQLGLGHGAQALGYARQRLCVAAQRAAEHGVKAQAAFAPVGAQALGLLPAARAQLVVVGSAKRGLAVAHEVEGSHAADFDKTGRWHLSCVRQQLSI